MKAYLPILLGIAISVGLTHAQEPAESAVPAGEWTVNYTNSATRMYTIAKNGKVSFQAENLKGQIKADNGMLLLVFDGDDRLERLTMGSDGRMFVEHYNPKADFPNKTAVIIGRP